MLETYPIISLLVNEVARSKAVIKYEARQLQVSLKRITEASDRSSFQLAAEAKPSVMWLDAIFQSIVKSGRINVVKKTIISPKTDIHQTKNARIEQLFNLIALQQAAVLFDKNVEVD